MTDYVQGCEQCMELTKEVVKQKMQITRLRFYLKQIDTHLGTEPYFVNSARTAAKEALALNNPEES